MKNISCKKSDSYMKGEYTMIGLQDFRIVDFDAFVEEEKKRIAATWQEPSTVRHEKIVYFNEIPYAVPQSKEYQISRTCKHGIHSAYCRICTKPSPRMRMVVDADCMHSNSTFCPNNRIDCEGCPFHKKLSEHQRLFDHQHYGEGSIGMLRHLADMTQSERLMFETFDLVSGEVVAPHINYGEVPVQYRASWISHHAPFQGTAAERLGKIFQILNLNLGTARERCDDITEDNALRKLIELEILAYEMEALQPSRQDAEQLTEEEEEELPPVQSMFSYHLVEPKETDWFLRQPLYVACFVSDIVNVDSRKELSRIAKDILSVKDKLTRTHQRVIWGYWKRIALRYDKPLSAKAQTIIESIKSTKHRAVLACIGTTLFADKSIPQSDAQEIWKHYKVRKGELMPCGSSKDPLGS